MVAIVLICALLAVAGSTARAWYVFRQPPQNNPRAFVHQRGKRVVAVIGASTVQGNVSFNFVDELARRFPSYQFVNAGRNGYSSEKVLTHLPETVATKPDFAVVMVGGNDVLMMHHTNLGQAALAATRAVPSLGWYKSNLVAIVEQLKKGTPARIALVTLPPMGENLGSDFNKYVDEANQVIEQVAVAQHVAVIPAGMALKQELLGLHADHGKDLFDSPRVILQGLWLRRALGLSLNMVSAINGYKLLTDGLHLNKRAGLVVTSEIEKFLHS